MPSHACHPNSKHSPRLPRRDGTWTLWITRVGFPCHSRTLCVTAISTNNGNNSIPNDIFHPSIPSWCLQTSAWPQNTPGELSTGWMARITDFLPLLGGKLVLLTTTRKTPAPTSRVSTALPVEENGKENIPPSLPAEENLPPLLPWAGIPELPPQGERENLPWGPATLLNTSSHGKYQLRM